MLGMLDVPHVTSMQEVETFICGDKNDKTIYIHLLCHACGEQIKDNTYYYLFSLGQWAPCDYIGRNI